VTILALDLPYIFSGAVFVETLFAWPGMGRLYYQAALQRQIGTNCLMRQRVAHRQQCCNLRLPVFFKIIQQPERDRAMCHRGLVIFRPVLHTVSFFSAWVCFVVFRHKLKLTCSRLYHQILMTQCPTELQSGIFFERSSPMNGKADFRIGRTDS
jgi:hypothetical protein